MGSSHELPRVLSQQSHTGKAISCDNMGNVTNQESSYQIQCPGFFIGGWSGRYPLPSMYLKSKLPEGKQVLSRNCIVCTNSSGTMSCSYHLEWCESFWSSSSQVPVQEQPGKQALLSISGLRPAMLNLFCTHGNKKTKHLINNCPLTTKFL